MLGNEEICLGPHLRHLKENESQLMVQNVSITKSLKVKM